MLIYSFTSVAEYLCFYTSLHIMPDDVPECGQEQKLRKFESEKVRICNFLSKFKNIRVILLVSTNSSLVSPFKCNDFLKSKNFNVDID